MRKKVKQNAIVLRQLIQTSRQSAVLLLEMLYGVFLTLSALLLFLKIHDEVLENEFMNFDMFILRLLHSWHTPILNGVMIVISALGHQLLLTAAILISIFLLRKHHKREAFLMFFIIGMTFLINISIKNLVQRPRPQYFPLYTLTDYSFPSGHSMESFVFYSTIGYFIFHFTKRKYFSLFIAVVCLIIIGLVGLSRVYLGVHYPSDVIAGYFGGLAWFSSVLLIEKTLAFYKLFLEHKQKHAVLRVHSSVRG